MTKSDLAQYLVNLHTLMEAQQATGGLNPSSILAVEYEKNWSLLKSTITKENENETRPRNDSNNNENRTDPSRDQSRRGSAVRRDGDI